MRDVDVSRASGDSFFDVSYFAFENTERVVFICKHALTGT